MFLNLDKLSFLVIGGGGSGHDRLVTAITHGLELIIRFGALGPPLVKSTLVVDCLIRVERQLEQHEVHSQLNKLNH